MSTMNQNDSAARFGGGRPVPIEESDIVMGGESVFGAASWVRHGDERSSRRRVVSDHQVRSVGRAADALLRGHRGVSKFDTFG